MIRTTFISLSISIFVLTISLSNNAKAQCANDSVFNASLISNIKVEDVNNSKKISLTIVQNIQPFTLFIFLSPECPLCKNYSGILNELYKQYLNKIQVYGIIPGKAYSIKTIKNFKQQYNLLFHLVIDSDKKLTEYLQASVTPQVILLNNKCELVYKGAIDNRVQSLGKQRVHATESFLQEALQQSIAYKTLLTKRTKAVGCRINDY